MKLEYTGKEPLRIVGGVAIKEVKKGDILECTDAQARGWLNAYPKSFKQVKDKKEGQE